MNCQLAGLKIACTTPAVEGMPVLKKTANTTSEARPHSSSSSSITSTSMPMLPRCESQQVSDAPRSCGWPCSRRRLASYRPIARKGPTRKHPDRNEVAYSGLLRNTEPSTTAISQKQIP